MDLDKTFEFATNLDRAAIEARLEEVRAAADALLLADVAQQLTGDRRHQPGGDGEAHQGRAGGAAGLRPEADDRAARAGRAQPPQLC